MLNIFTVKPTASAVAMGTKLINVNFRNPTRNVWVMVNDAAWSQLGDVPLAYRPIVDAALVSSAKSIINAYVNERLATDGGIMPTGIPSAMLDKETIIDGATSSGMAWITKEELETAWLASATRRALYDADKYKTSKPYRVAFERFASLVLKLAGKQSQYLREDLDWMLAKFNESDADSDFGAFYTARVAALMAKPEKAIEVDRDLL